MDSDCLVFRISLEAADDVCVKLDHLVRNETLSKDDIFHKHMKDAVHFYINPRKHLYDKEVIEFFNTIQYLGGDSTANFLRGQAWHGKEEEAKVILRAKLKRVTFRVYLQLHAQNSRRVTQ